MATNNMVLLIGNIGNTPKYTEVNGKSLLTFSMATNEDIAENKTLTTWHTIKCWGNYAKSIKNKLSKGQKVTVVGAIRSESWEKDGNKRYTTIIRPETVSF